MSLGETRSTGHRCQNLTRMVLLHDLGPQSLPLKISKAPSGVRYQTCEASIVSTQGQDDGEQAASLGYPCLTGFSGRVASEKPGMRLVRIWKPRPFERVKEQPSRESTRACRWLVAMLGPMLAWLMG